ncbi:MAG TPA: acyl-CoA dehydrogenase family protein [Candidatus Binatia bacterium]
MDDRAAPYVDRIRALAPLVRAHVAQAERECQLSAEVVEGFHDTGVFRMFLPRDLDGGGLTVPESLQVIEAAARIDGSAGWNVAICSGGPLFGSFISRKAYEQIFADPRTIVAGSLNPLGTRATIVDGGYRFSGRATYISGSAHAQWLMATAMLLVDGAPQIVDGFPRMRSGLFPMRHCRILDTWSVSGMRGTGSNDCTFEDVLVPEEFTYESPNPTATWQTGPLAAIPLTTQLGSSLAAVAIGVARHAIDAFLELAVTKVPVGTRSTLRERPLGQIQLAQAQGLVEAAHAYLSAAVEEVWRRGGAGEPFDPQARAAARLASVTAARLAAQAVDLIFDAAGATSIQTTCDIERCWRDVHAITQHVIMSTGRYEVIGRVLLGLDPGAPII